MVILFELNPGEFCDLEELILGSANICKKCNLYKQHNHVCIKFILSG